MADNAECAAAINFFLEMFTQNNLIIPSCLLRLTLLAASSASSTYVKYACGASSLPPRYPLNPTWYYCGHNPLFD
jgi:hypothetical protein